MLWVLLVMEMVLLLVVGLECCRFHLLVGWVTALLLQQGWGWQGTVAGPQ